MKSDYKINKTAKCRQVFKNSITDRDFLLWSEFQHLLCKGLVSLEITTYSSIKSLFSVLIPNDDCKPFYTRLFFKA